MTTISIRPIGQEAPVITGEVVDEGKSEWYIQLAASIGWTPFPKDEWELVPVPFVFPTAFGARITGVNTFKERRRFVLADEWLNQQNEAWSQKNITDLFTDLRVVEADPDWGDE